MAAVQPDWAKLGIEPAKLEVQDAETGERLALTARRGFELSVPRHDVRLVLAGAPGAYEARPEKLGAELPRPREVLKDLSDALDGAELAPGWQKDLHDGHSGVWMLDGRLCVQGAHYGFAHARRELGVDNVSAQCLIMRPATGCMDGSGASLFLLWPNGECAQATPGTCEGKFTYFLSGVGEKKGSDISRRAVPGWYPYFANWVRIALSPDKVSFYGSSDGKEWVKDWEAKRGPKHAGAPQWLILGNGQRGQHPHLDNVHPQHFHATSPTCAFFSDLVVGRD
jgi:hypothetical protein